MEYNKKCSECNERFKTNRPYQIYCSKLCSKYGTAHRTQKERDEKRRKNPIIYPVEKCLYCKGNFYKKQYNHVYCSYSCSNKYWWAKQEKNYCSSNKITHWLKLRFDILNRDNFTCQYCGRSPKNGAILNIDHIRSKNKGGKYVKENLITSCYECNQGKGDILLSKRKQEKLK